MIGQIMINIDFGGRTRFSRILVMVSLLALIIFSLGIIGIIPLDALMGVMSMVALGTFEFSSINFLGQIPKSDAFVLILVSFIIVVEDLAITVCAGVVVSKFLLA